MKLQVFTLYDSLLYALVCKQMYVNNTNGFVHVELKLSTVQHIKYLLVLAYLLCAVISHIFIKFTQHFVHSPYLLELRY